MKPAFSVVFFTTLAISARASRFPRIGRAPSWMRRPLDARPQRSARSSPLALAVSPAVGCQLLHLSRPSAPWRTAAQWRTSWLPREVIVAAGFIALVLAWRP